jgi:hypothetical protein
MDIGSDEHCSLAHRAHDYLAKLHTGYADVIVRHRSPIFAAAVEPIFDCPCCSVTGLSDTKLGQRVWRLCSVVTLLGDDNVPESLKLVDEIPRSNSARSATIRRPGQMPHPALEFSQAARLSRMAGRVQ